VAQSDNRAAVTKTGKRKAPSTAYKPGVSGNPGGRPKGLAEMQALCRDHSEAAINALLLALKSVKTRVPAAVALLDRGWGKPSQPIEGDVGFGALLEVLEARRLRPGPDAK